MIFLILNSNPIACAPQFNFVKSLSPDHILDLNLYPSSVLTPVGLSRI